MQDRSTLAHWLQEIAFFLVVAKSGNFTKAGAVLGIPVPTVRRRVTDLEGYLKTKLLFRSTRGLSLTEQGHQLFEKMDPIFEQARIVRDDVFQTKSQPLRFLHISMVSSVFQGVVVPHLREFAMLHPEISLQIKTEWLSTDLIADHLDIALRMSSMTGGKNLCAHALPEVRAGLYATQAYLRAHGVPKCPEDLVKHECIDSMAGASDKAVWFLQRGASRSAVSVQARYATDNTSMSMELAAQDFGITLWFDQGNEAEILQRRLKRVLPEWYMPISFVAVTPSRALAPHAKIFLDFLGEKLRLMLPQPK